MRQRGIWVGSLALGLAGCVAPAIPAGPAPALAAAPAAVSAAPAPVARAAAPAGSVQAHDLPSYVADELLVQLAPGIEASTFLAGPAAAGLVCTKHTQLPGGLLLTVTVGAVGLAAARVRLSEDPHVARVSTNTLAYTQLLPNDPRQGEQWSSLAQFSNTQGAWDQIAADKVDQRNVIVADLDTGLDVSHEEFAGRVVAPYNAVVTDKPGTPPSAALAADTTDYFGHGTFTAGIAAAAGNNSLGIAGVAWNVKIMPIKADHLDQRTAQFGAFTLGDILNGLAYAIDHSHVEGQGDVRVINMSLGQDSAGLEPLYVDAINLARRKGILVVASSGNFGEDFIPPPANTPGVIAVGSTTRYLNFELLSGFSCYGPRIDLVAPGDGIISTCPSAYRSALGARSGPDLRKYAYGSGTSEAAPYVTGVAALVFAKYDPGNKSLDTPEHAAAMVDAVRAHLLKSVDDLGPPGWDPGFGWGRINAKKAVADASLPAGTPPEFF